MAVVPLTQQITPFVESDAVAVFKDPYLDAPDDLVLRWARLALSCTAMPATSRPSMNQVLGELLKLKQEIFKPRYNDMLENWAWHVQAVGLGGHFIIFAADQTALAFATSKWPGQAVLLPFSGQFGQEEKISNFESAHFYGDAGFHKVASHQSGREGNVGGGGATAEGGGEGAGKASGRAEGVSDGAGTEREEERQQKRQLQEEQGQKGVGGGSQGNEEEGAQKQQSEQQQEEQKEQEEEQTEGGEEDDFDVYLTLDESVLVNASSACRSIDYPWVQQPISSPSGLHVHPTSLLPLTLFPSSPFLPHTRSTSGRSIVYLWVYLLPFHSLTSLSFLPARTLSLCCLPAS
ncbi:unnamed protein product [Closterium sp. Naga37s-1]|nr:unnamed protein product [Closterium sp. Naga37s-1]